MSARTPSGVNATLTRARPARTRGARGHRVVENGEFAAFTSRVVRAAGRRVAAGDIDGLPALAALSAKLDAAIADAVVGLRGHGYSWAEIAARLGITRQAAHQRWNTGDTSRTGAAS
jgi:DNA-directed RNA polymerase specialized sigma24 family protein